MRRALTITTPENVVLSFELAGVGSRFIACLLDSLLQGLGVVILVGIVVAGTELFERIGLRAVWGSAVLLAVMSLAIFALLSGYYIFFESRWNGQTPGKKAVGLRVVRDGGLPIDFPAAVVRNLCRAADFLPALYAIGLVSILVSKDYKRLGDYVAGTLVVKERKEEGLAPPVEQSPRKQYVLLDEFALRRISQLSRGQYEAAKRYVERSGQLDRGLAERLGEKIGKRIGEVLQAEPPGADWVRYLEEVVGAYEERMSRRAGPSISRR